MLLKVISVILIGFIIYLIFFKNKRVDGTKKNDKLISDEMVECPACGTFVSQSEAIVSSGKFFCSKDCLNKKKV
ncbi:PP0621 family protein [Arcobacter vandammei]|uniref:PP0621 family protein n=1 Tax=Arcobacter vandammei TaxID=2782243 RepID=UPI0018DEF9C4|nr:PP0621 family protein [Arcobacter vandammei]